MTRKRVMENTKKNGFDAAYEEAFNLACRELMNKDIYQCCKDAGADISTRLDARFLVSVKFMEKIVTIEMPEFKFTVKGSYTVDIWEKILILHYLTNANAYPLTDSLITYRQIKSGSVYYPTFEKRSIIPFTNFFAENPDSLLNVAGHLNGEKYDSGDIGIKLMAFPFVPLYFVFWKGDDEFPASGNILFDSTIEKKLSAEDVAVLCQQIVFKLIHISKKDNSNS